MGDINISWLVYYQVSAVTRSVMSMDGIVSNGPDRDIGGAGYTEPTVCKITLVHR